MGLVLCHGQQPVMLGFIFSPGLVRKLQYSFLYRSQMPFTVMLVESGWNSFGMVTGGRSGSGSPFIEVNLART
jgi:hypothetical protein